MNVAPRTATLSGPFLLEGGGILEEVVVAYEEYGPADADGRNTVLVCHGLTADAHAAGRHAPTDRAAGWWDAAIGPGKAVDTDRYRVLCANVLGGAGGTTGPGSSDPRTGRPFGLRFPVVTVRDMVGVQAALADHLGIARFRAVVGGCLGGFQVLEWMARFPERLERAVAISATPRTSAHNLAFFEVLRQAITRDPRFAGGDYYGGELPADGLALAAMFGAVVWLGRETMERKLGVTLLEGTKPRFTLGPEFTAQAFLAQIAENAPARLDANSFIYLTRATDYFDLARDAGSLAGALAGFQGRTLLVSYASDWRYPRAEVDAIRVALEANGASVTHATLESDFGHGAFVYDVDGVGDLLRRFLSD